MKTAAEGGKPDGRLVFALLLVAVVGVQIISGAYASDMADSDEPAHFISGLLVRDYLWSGWTSPPLDYARAYYSHYPKIGIGNWPPLFYGLEGLWMLPLPAHPGAVLVLMAIITAALAWLVFRALLPVTGTAYALLGAALLILLRPVPVLAGLVMLEIPLALASLVAVGCWWRFMDRPNFLRGVLFGAATLIAVLTKWNAFFLLLVPPLALLIARRWALLRSRGVLITAAALVVVVGPLAWLLAGELRSGWQDALPSLEFVVSALVSYGRFMVRSAGIAGVLLLGVGLVTCLRRGVPGASMWASAAALVAAVVLFHALIPAGIAARYLIPALPGVAILIAGGAWTVGSWLRASGLGRTRADILVIAVFGLAFAVDAFRLPPKAVRGYSEAAELVVAQGLPTTSLVFSDAIGEGAYIAAVAVRDPARPCHVVWRGTNLLALSTWAGREYRLRTADDEAVLGLLDRAAIEYVVIDRGFGRFEHQDQMERVIERWPERFTMLSEFVASRRDRRPPDGVAIYRYLEGSGGVAAGSPSIRQVPGYDGVAEAMTDPFRATGCPP